jgi:hypothetical protein
MFQRIALLFLLAFTAATAQETSTPDYFRVNADRLLNTKVFLNVAYASLSDPIRKDDMSDLNLYCIDRKSGSYSYFDALVLKDNLKLFLKRVGTDYDYKSGNVRTTKVSGVLRKSSTGFLFLDLTEREPIPGSKQEPSYSSNLR